MFDLNSTSNTSADNDSEKRIALLSQMRIDLVHYKDMLDFFEPIFRERQRYAEALTSGLNIAVDDEIIYHLRNREGLKLLTKSDIICDSPIINDHFLRLYAIIKQEAPETVETIETLIHQDGGFHFDTLIDYGLNKAQTVPDNIMIDFLIDETLGPLLKIYADKLKKLIGFSKWVKEFCPVCGKKPSFALLKQEDGKRILVCSACSTHWEFKRLKCTFCGNEDQKQMAYLVVEHDDMYRIETCEACGCYLKTIDLKNATHEIFYDIESIITLHLDIVARNKGYSDTYSPSPPLNGDQIYRYA